MTQMTEIKNGDFIGVVKVVNNNTLRLDKKIDNLEENVINLGKAYNKYIKYNSKAMKSFCIGGILIAFAGIATQRQLNKLEQRVKYLEDAKTVNDYMREDAGDDCK